MFFYKKVKISKKTNYNISVRGEQTQTFPFYRLVLIVHSLLRWRWSLMQLLEKIIPNFQIFFENGKLFHSSDYNIVTTRQSVSRVVTATALSFLSFPFCRIHFFVVGFSFHNSYQIPFFFGSGSFVGPLPSLIFRLNLVKI